MKDYKKAQEIVTQIAKLRQELEKIDYNKTLKIIPDFVECYARDRFNLKLENKMGYDGIGVEDEKKYQIKYTILKKNGKLSNSLDNIKLKMFHYLIAVMLDEDYKIIHVYKIPEEFVAKPDHINQGRFRIEKLMNDILKFEILPIWVE